MSTLLKCWHHFHAFIHKWVLKELINCFIAAAGGISIQKILDVLTVNSSSNFYEAIDELFQQLLDDECMKWCQHLNIVPIAYFPLSRKQLMDTFTANRSSSFNEAVDELFQHPFVDECKEIMSILLSNAYCLFCFEKKKDFQCFSCRSIQQLQWSSWRAVPAAFGWKIHRTWCQYFCYMC